MQDAKNLEQPPLSVVIADNVYRLRVLKLPRWSQAKLAEESHLSRNTVALIEEGRDPERASNAVRLDTLERLAAALGVEPSELLRWDPAKSRVYRHGKGTRRLTEPLQMPLMVAVT